LYHSRDNRARPRATRNTAPALGGRPRYPTLWSARDAGAR
jgi:hypothetical protein